MSIENTSEPNSVMFRDTETLAQSLAANFELKPDFFDDTRALERARKQEGLQDVDTWLNGLQVKHDAPTLVADISYGHGRYNIGLKTNGDLPDNVDPNKLESSLAALVTKEAKLNALVAMGDEIPVAYASLRAKIKNELIQVREDKKTFAKHIGDPVIPNLKSLSKDPAPAIKISRKGIVNGVLTTAEIAALAACAVFTNDIPAHTELPQNTRYTATTGEVSPEFHSLIVEQVAQDDSLKIVQGAEFSITLDDGDPSTPPITVGLEAVEDKESGDTGFITDDGKILGIDNGDVNPNLFSIYDTQSGLTVIDADISDIEDGDDKVELRYYPYALTPVTDLPGYDGRPIKINQKTTWLTGVRQRRAAAAPAASPTVAPATIVAPTTTTEATVEAPYNINTNPENISDITLSFNKIDMITFASWIKLQPECKKPIVNPPNTSIVYYLPLDRMIQPKPNLINGNYQMPNFAKVCSYHKLSLNNVNIEGFESKNPIFFAVTEMIDANGNSGTWNLAMGKTGLEKMKLNPNIQIVPSITIPDVADNDLKDKNVGDADDARAIARGMGNSKFYEAQDITPKIAKLIFEMFIAGGWNNKVIDNGIDYGTVKECAAKYIFLSAP